ncbi:hypothetical protein DQ04_09021000 [Trypanosoma grayi]|uniref:hypothetical protein n=1 Tax=Trypanosoma grayi TaxID=71804 RepID=UPI0004F48FE2|nr:hypothetical protein DQ04_09021000 [Trypanosoma grayi]KEG07709.1 hypothetical protein DQ04_09021000 [Trypanosoma grayi]
MTTFHRVGFVGSDWEALMRGDSVTTAFVKDVAECVDVLEDNVRVAEYKVGDNLVFDIYVEHRSDVGEADVDKLLKEASFARVWAIYKKEKTPVISDLQPLRAPLRFSPRTPSFSSLQLLPYGYRSPRLPRWGLGESPRAAQHDWQTAQGSSRYGQTPDASSNILPETQRGTSLTADAPATDRQKVCNASPALLRAGTTRLPFLSPVPRRTSPQSPALQEMSPYISRHPLRNLTRVPQRPRRVNLREVSQTLEHKRYQRQRDGGQRLTSDMSQGSPQVHNPGFSRPGPVNRFQPYLERWRPPRN